VQFFQDTYKKLCNYCRSTLQINSQRLWLQRWSITKRGHGCFLHSKKLTFVRTCSGFSTCWQTICPFTDAATGTADTAGSLGAILTQKDKFNNFYAISYASRQLKDHEKNYSPFVLESAAAVWGMDTFNKYLKGKQFILNTDHKPLEKIGHLHTKTMNR
jgi:hypothetical protein